MHGDLLIGVVKQKKIETIKIFIFSLTRQEKKGKTVERVHVYIKCVLCLHQESKKSRRVSKSRIRRDRKNRRVIAFQLTKLVEKNVF